MYWCITHIGDEKLVQSKHDELMAQGGCGDKFSYMVGQLERCPKSGALHSQMYVEMVKKARAKELQGKKYFGAPVHAEERYGTAEQASVYCTTDKTFTPAIVKRKKLDESLVGTPDLSWIAGTQFEYGEMSQPETLADLIEKVKEGMPISEIMLKFPILWMRNHNALDRMVAEHAPKVVRKEPKVHWLYGGAGIGKTTFPDDLHMGLPIFYISDINNWKGYKGEQVVVFNETRKSWFQGEQVEMMKQMLDFKPFECNTKGGSVSLMAEHFFFTSNWDPTTFIPVMEESISRRILSITRVDPLAGDAYVARKPIMGVIKRRLVSVEDGKPIFETVVESGYWKGRMGGGDPKGQAESATEVAGATPESLKASPAKAGEV